jgi:hypothetical protein
MSLLQKLVPPIAGDSNGSQAINLALAPLCAQSHEHAIFASTPTANEGSDGDIAMSSNGTKIYIKQGGSWYQATLTAV